MLATAIIPLQALCQTAIEEDVNSADYMTFGFETDLASRYIWRGLTFSPGVVSQSYAWMSIANLTGSVWSNYDFKAAGNDPSLNELDFSVSYSSSMGPLSIEPSVQAYFYPDQPEYPSTAEAAMLLSFGPSLFEFFTIHTLDIKEYQGAYFGEFGLGSSWDAGDRLSMEISSSLGWGSAKFNEVYIGEHKSALELVSCEAGAIWYFSDYLYVRPHMMLTTILGHDLRAMVDSPTRFQVGMALGGEF
ncbi:MAG: hypothetical protein AB1746_08300 [Candidatus Zixiibacteriota bacterium]